MLRSTSLIHCGIGCVFFVFATVPVGVHAQSVLSLADAERAALDAEPGHAAILARADALRERSVAVGRLPDPQLRVGIANYPVESGGFATEGMTQAKFGLRQSFPPGKTRALSTQQFEERARQLDRTADVRVRDVLTQVRHAWLDTYYWQQAHHIVSRARPYFADLVTVSQSLYGVGRRDQQDVLRAELELSRLDDRLINISQQRARAAARLSEWVTEASTRDVADELPPWEQLPALEALVAALAGHPNLQAAAAEVQARHTGISLAEQRYKPGWALDLEYGYRDGTLANGTSRSDFMSLMVSMDLPFFSARRQDRAVAAARKERHAARFTRAQLHRELEAQLRAQYAMWQDLSRQIALYERTILPQAEDRARAALLAYQNDRGAFADVMQGQVDALNVRVLWERLRVERAQSFAVLANLGDLKP